MAKRKKVLIVDDSIELCLLLKAYFLRKNYETFLANNCYTAIEQAKETSPDVILLNSNVCGNSTSLIQKLKEAAPDAELIVDNMQQWHVL